MLEILIVDPNKVYASMIKATLVEQLREPNVDIAVNVHELRRRLRNNKYDVILADLSTSMDGEEMQDALKMADEHGSTVVVWSVLSGLGDDGTRVLKKPLCRFELRNTISTVLQETRETRVHNLEETQLMVRT